MRESTSTPPSNSELLKTKNLSRPPMFSRKTLLKHDELREQRRLKEIAAPEKQKSESEIKSELIGQIKAVLEQYQAVLPFLPKNQEQAFPMPDGSRVLMVKNEDRLMILQTTDPNKQAPSHHHWGKDNGGNDPIVSSPDVLKWQMVIFPSSHDYKVTSFYNYPRPLLDQVAAQKATLRWGNADPQVEDWELKDQSTSELQQLISKLHTVMVIPEQLLQLRAEFESRFANLTQKLVALREIKRRYGNKTFIKVVGEEKWLYFDENSLHVLNSPHPPESYSRDRFSLSQSDIMQPGKLTAENYQTAIDAAQLILDLPLGPPSQ